ncbi:DNA phosphorothioation-associated putative methyltransferase [Bacteriovorax sp. Seq25_V]|uniref:DNA phosphorothioation-associated putative methyltransferase n=1 Tax=Bacteriovorax sp. Seq25_V TaxID=1201288 RepID=UPI000557D0BA|nr:DNA phosphorothioation-associated putative methyltransferase [Bacteriovorax sp. Seq25_V]
MIDINIERHKTAIKRNKVSRPVSLLLESNLLTQESSFFDYGCGHGQDLTILAKNGFSKIQGYDPYYRPDSQHIKSDIVNLGFVLNVIEKPNERSETLKTAYSLANKLLCVSVMTKIQQGYEGISLGDGVLSSRGTFQKYYEQEEIKNYLESLLDKDAIAIAPGIFFIFRYEQDKLNYLQSRYKRPVILDYTRIDPISKERTRVKVFKPKLEELIKESPFFEETISFLFNHGRLPTDLESSSYKELIREFKSKTKVKSLLLENIDQDRLEQIRQSRVTDLLVFFALRKFDRKGFPKQSDLPENMVLDIKEFLGTYSNCKREAENLLFSIGNQTVMQKSFRACNLGKQLPDAFYIHPSLINKLPAPIQVKVGIAKKLVGDIDECNLLKINKLKDKVSFLVYEDFDSIAHPALLYTLVMDIPKNNVKFWEFRQRENPPILHRKDTFIDEDYPLFDKFKKLTLKEEKFGLLGHNHIGTRLNWEKFLQEEGFIIKGHQLKKL